MFAILFQSVFPPKLTLGQSKRHHAVMYLHAQLKPQYTANSLNKLVKIDPGEVGACAWFDRSKVKAIVSAREEGKQGDVQNVCDSFRYDYNILKHDIQLHFFL